ncbi:MAG TPA: hypothetical protein DCQ26_09390 [Marinilabiliales bacterium]|jgi:hypothetical protein|nr:MAG: hypothetical protein A2W95_17875 [Bacteroidetes bacterium GWA2_40_14]OFX65161.1 MAG: hypothetical protein A2W84_16895 [Bacteroidetes bacterium GWC2_40_13]OFX74337.1 MAG: hypothetical protein A2W96_13510 [Bacteroidetes bacterium GWD2_40_43]OFX90928.1 MAG: hypothetical protein A2W97_07850 [Bacteroidetes bacterium GWE2_40_63]OFY21142.1 MAG: hypothetical protein A2W88_18825 [Bacteroidetes bacterium GWF2_40_13]OFZ25379.1 MAG: hypothetical protein A2437_01475 [Bacteroidetes bacterium RIFOXYC
MSNYISASIPDESKVKALELISQLKALFPFGIKLSNEQRKTMTKIDDARVPFTEKALQYGKQEPRIVPPYTDLDELTRDLNLYKGLSQIEKELLSLTETIVDTRIAAGADAYQASLSIYSSSKGAAKMGVPGTQSIVEDLKKVFESQGIKPVKEAVKG